MITGAIFFVCWLFAFFVLLPMFGYMLPELPENIGIVDILFTPAYMTVFVIHLFVSLIVAIILTIIFTTMVRKGTGGFR